MSSKSSKNRRSRPLNAPRRLSDQEILSHLACYVDTAMIGEIHNIMIPSILVGEPADMLFVLKIAESKNMAEAFRWFDNYDEAVGARMLRGLEDPGKKSVRARFGKSVLRP